MNPSKVKVTLVIQVVFCSYPAAGSSPTVAISRKRSVELQSKWILVRLGLTTLLGPG